MSIEQLGGCGLGIGAFWKLEREGAKRASMAQILVRAVALEALALVSLVYHAVGCAVGKIYQSSDTLKRKHIEPLKQSLALMRHAYAKAAKAHSISGAVRQEAKILFPSTQKSFFDWLNTRTGRLCLTAVAVTTAIGVGLYMRYPNVTPAEEIEADRLFTQWKDAKEVCERAGGLTLNGKENSGCIGMTQNWGENDSPSIQKPIHSGNLFANRTFESTQCADERLKGLCKELRSKPVFSSWARSVLEVSDQSSCPDIKSAYLRKFKELVPNRPGCVDGQKNAWLNCLHVARDIAGKRCSLAANEKVNATAWDRIHAEKEKCFKTPSSAFGFGIAEQWDTPTRISYKDVKLGFSVCQESVKPEDRDKTMAEYWNAMSMSDQ